MENNIEKRKAYSYIRMSTDIQLKGDSLRRQLEASKIYAEKNNLELIETIQDIGVSAYSGNNATAGALGRFLEALKLGKIDPGSVLIVESIDRISRQSITTAFQKFTSILEYQITIVTLVDNQVYTIESVNENPGQLFSTLGIMLRANDESKTKSVRGKATWANKRNSINERKYTSICPAWLELDKSTGNFIEIPTLVNSVKKIFEMSIDGHGAFSIANYLNANNDQFPPKNRQVGWYMSYIKKIINNKAVYGEFQTHKMENGKRVISGEPTPNYFPAIISKQDFEISQARHKQRKPNAAGRKGHTFSNIFTRLVRCYGCGSIVVFRNKGLPPKGVRYLRCGNSERKLSCHALPWSYDDFETSFFTYVTEIDFESIFMNPDALTNKHKMLEELEVLEMQIKDRDYEYQLLLDRFGIVPESLLPDLMEKATNKQTELQSMKKTALLLKNELRELDREVDTNLLKENILSYQNSIRNKSEIEIKEIRQKIHYELRHLITEIRFYNLDTFCAGDDISEITDAQFIAALKKRRYKTPEQQVQYLLTDAGNRFFNEYLRFYTVKFRNGVLKQVRPSVNHVVNFNNSTNKPQQLG